MTAAAKKIERDLRELPLADLLALHDRLVLSIHRKEESEPVAPESLEELKRRVEEIDSGRVAGSEAFAALKEM